MLEFWKLWLKNKSLLKDKRGDLELDELGKVILGLIVLLILIVIVTVVIRGEFSSQEDKVEGMFDIFG